MTISVINEKHEMCNVLVDFVQNGSRINFFQSSEYFNFINNLVGYKPISIVARSSDDKYLGVLVAILIKEPKFKGYFSRRCIIIDGPILNEVNSEVVSLMLKKLNQIAKQASIYTEFRNLNDMSHYHAVFKTAGFTYHQHLNYRIKTYNLESVSKSLSTGKQRQINKSLKSGAEIIEAENLDQVRKFYEILSDLYQTKIKNPLPGWDFFKNFYQCGNLGKYFLIRYEGNIIGGMMCPIYNGIIYEWYIAGRDREFKNVYPSVLATWAAIEYGVNNGLKYFDFMGAGKPDDDYGVREFKAKFGGELQQHGRYLRINKPILYTLGKIGLGLIKAMK